MRLPEHDGRITRLDVAPGMNTSVVLSGVSRFNPTVLHFQLSGIDSFSQVDQ